MVVRIVYKFRTIRMIPIEGAVTIGRIRRFDHGSHICRNPLSIGVFFGEFGMNSRGLRWNKRLVQFRPECVDISKGHPGMPKGNHFFFGGGGGGAWDSLFFKHQCTISKFPLLILG